MLRLEVENLAKWFGPRKIFENIGFALNQGQSIAVVGPNGSGKTTLLRLIIGLAFPTRGMVTFSQGGEKLDFDQYRRKLALVAPYMSLYGSLTARENLRFLSVVDGRPVADPEIEMTLERVGLAGRGEDPVSAYSTGMQQRLKYAAALLKEPGIILVDEPGANLDESGKGIAFDLIESYRDKAIVIVATNEKEEYSLADGLCQLGG
jgi:heme exporter protein A